MPQPNLQYLSIDNFSPGIWDNSRMAGGSITPAPIGAAQRIGTYRCMALPGGGLGPLPAPSEGFIADVTGSPTGGRFAVTGMIAHGPFSPASPAFALHPTVRDVLHYAVEWVDTVGPQRKIRWNRLNAYRDIATATSIYAANGLTTDTARYYGASFDSTRLIPDNLPPTSGSYYPVVVFGWSDWNEVTGLFGSTNTKACSPKPGSIALNFFQFDATTQGQIFAHQNRLICLDNNVWTSGVDVTALHSITNELIDFTDPPTTMTMTYPGQLLGAEGANQFSVWASIDSQSLLLIRASGGGLLVSGDIKNPVVQRLTNVVSPGQFTMRGMRCPLGIAYVAEDDGAYVYSGGASQKISLQLDDGSFRRTQPAPTYGETHHLDSWGQWLMFPNNWVYDSASQSWWLIEDQNVRRHDLWSKSAYRESQMWSGLGNFATNVEPVFYQWDKNNLASSYAWTSHPLPISINRQVRVREAEIMCNLPLGNQNYTVTVTAYSADGTSSTFTKTLNLGAPGLMKVRGSLNVHGYAIVVKVEIAASPATVPACILHSIGIGWDEGTTVGAG